MTPTARRIRKLLDAGDEAGAAALLPAERPYPLPAEVAAVIVASSG